MQNVTIAHIGIKTIERDRKSRPDHTMHCSIHYKRPNNFFSVYLPFKQPVLTVVPIKSDSDVILCLQLLS